MILYDVFRSDCNFFDNPLRIVKLGITTNVPICESEDVVKVNLFEKVYLVFAIVSLRDCDLICFNYYLPLRCTRYDYQKLSLNLVEYENDRHPGYEILRQN